ncbi:DUF402 domain-containing protein [Gracilibacillus oryzae]|uniref:DUF402 domain-containing protein n=1 Tax=Gracilibacillus oryzae TaxID=1672701 RepID=A0A7C8KU57_9BACI|nr:DUF402 domain-containing protein [Gracilibacillus oryzae]KAB8136224.1 DUF402 domain-containing protein [Gracilibacillus oryzae]
MTFPLFFYNLHLPDEVRIFEVPNSGVRRFDHNCIVFDVEIQGAVLRHYSFKDRWFEINVSLTKDGNFRTEEHHHISWCFNCDISTPHLEIVNNIYNADLFLDVLVEPDGKTYAVIDENDFEWGIANDFLSKELENGAKKGLDDLLSIIETEGLINFLNHYYPLHSFGDIPVQPKMNKVSLSNVEQYKKIKDFSYLY